MVVTGAGREEGGRRRRTPPTSLGTHEWRKGRRVRGSMAVKVVRRKVVRVRLAVVVVRKLFKRSRSVILNGMYKNCVNLYV